MCRMRKPRTTFEVMDITTIYRLLIQTESSKLHVPSQIVKTEWCIFTSLENMSAHQHSVSQFTRAVQFAYLAVG